ERDQRTAHREAGNRKGGVSQAGRHGDSRCDPHDDARQEEPRERRQHAGLGGEERSRKQQASLTRVDRFGSRTTGERHMKRLSMLFMVVASLGLEPACSNNSSAPASGEGAKPAASSAVPDADKQWTMQNKNQSATRYSAVSEI